MRGGGELERGKVRGREGGREGEREGRGGLAGRLVREKEGGGRWYVKGWVRVC